MDTPTTESLRDTIEEAFESAQTPAAAPEAAASEPLEPTPPLDDAPADTTEAAPEAQDLNALADGKPRDDKGKFKKAEPPAEITPGPKSGPKEGKAPASWRPEVREHWAKLPPDVRAEVARREQEVQRTLQETAESRKYAEAFARTLQPYEAYIRAENATPLQAIDNLMATAVKLRTGTGPELANLVAGMVQQFGVGRFGPSFVEMLDGALAGNTPRVDPQQAQLQQAIQQQLAPVQQFMSQFQQVQAMQQAQMANQASSEVAQFLERAEFANDVREEMADLMEVAQRRGRELTLQEAYQQACMANPRVRTVLQQRAKAKQAQQGSQVVQRARNAAVSVSGAPALGAPQQASATDVRSAIEAAIAMTSR